MKMILGVDIGGSATKIAGLKQDGTVLSTLRVRAEDPLTSLYGAIGSYLVQNHLTLDDVARVVLTGVGASYPDAGGRSIPLCKVDEFHASAAGALYLSGQEGAVIASLGTGTAFLWADSTGVVRHICGSGIGGGTLVGLCRQLAGTQSFSQIQALLEEGDTTKVDLAIRDVCFQSADSLDPSMTASNFGKAAGDALPADRVAGALNLVLEAIGTMTVLACRNCKTRTVVLTGSLVMLPQAREKFNVFEKLYDIQYFIPDNAVFATAIGAARYSLSLDPH